MRFDHRWLLAALAIEAELFYLLGLRLQKRFLCYLAIPLFGLELVHLTAVELSAIPVSAWAPVVAATAAVFYVNRALRATDLFYGYAGAALAALVGGCEVPPQERSRVWFALSAIPFVVGWWRRLPDFRYQSYFLACLGAMGALFVQVHPPLSFAIGAVAAYALAACANWSAEDRLPAGERLNLFGAASTAGALFLAMWLYGVLPREAWGAAWAAQSLLVIAAAPAIGRQIMRLQGCALAAAAFLCCWIADLPAPNVVPALAVAAAIACFFAAQLLSERGDRQRLFFSLLATALTSGLLFYRISGSVLTVAWGAQGLALLGVGFPLRDRTLRFSGLALLLFCILKLFLYDLRHLETLPRIFSFMALGLILVGVSWIYTRFRGRVQKYL